MVMACFGLVLKIYPAIPSYSLKMGCKYHGMNMVTIHYGSLYPSTEVLPSVRDFLYCGKALKYLKEWTRRWMGCKLWAPWSCETARTHSVCVCRSWPMTNRSTSGFAVETQQKHLGMGCTLSLTLPDFFRPSVSNSDFPSRLVWPGWTKEEKKERETFERCFQTEPDC